MDIIPNVYVGVAQAYQILSSLLCIPKGPPKHSMCGWYGRSRKLLHRWTKKSHSISLVYKQIYTELPKSSFIMSQNALQFSNLVTAEEYLFGLDENIRASITHLRLAVPYSLTTPQYLPYYRDGNIDEWRGIFNYSSNP